MAKRTMADKIIMDAYKNSNPNVCFFCGEKNMKKITADHKNPLSRGGKTEFDNLCNCCDSCNNEKGDMNAEEYLIYKSLKNEDKANYLKEIEKKIRNEKLKDMSYGNGNLSIGVPRDTEKLISIREIVIPKEFKNIKIDMKQINIIKEYLEKYFDIYNVVYLSEDNILLSGYKEYLATKLTGINMVPVKYKKANTKKLEYNNRFVKVPVETEKIIPINEVRIPTLNENNKYSNISKICCDLFYSKFNYLNKPLLITDDNYVLEGINNYLISKEKNIDFVPVQYLKF